MLTYNQVKAKVEALEQKWFLKVIQIFPHVPVQQLTSGHIQFFSCENHHRDADADSPLHVIVGVGINYAQNKPHASFPSGRPHIYDASGGATWVEDYAPEMRQALDKTFFITSTIKRSGSSTAMLLPVD